MVSVLLATSYIKGGVVNARTEPRDCFPGPSSSVDFMALDARAKSLVVLRLVSVWEPLLPSNPARVAYPVMNVFDPLLFIVVFPYLAGALMAWCELD